MLYLPRRRRVSVKLNVVLTCVEVSGLLIIMGIGVWAINKNDESMRFIIRKANLSPPPNIHPCVFKRLRERNISNVLL
jgi:hypothetical protein